MDLDEWEAHLAAHYTLLHEERLISGASSRLYALEHGLSPPQVEELQEAVRDHIRRSRPSNRHRLAWVVYATESGYAYSGDEYWQTFEHDTPGWAAWGSRNWLRSCFRYFAEHFGGAAPTGTWADHFTIIAWPIAHAILPKDLQRHLARTLYELRHSLTPEYTTDPDRLGHLIHRRSSTSSSRFQQLTQETTLIGQIAAALLFRTSQEGSSQILPSTLERIATDLDEERRAREWLRDAQAATVTKLRQSRLNPAQRTSTEAQPGSRESLGVDNATIALEPHLLLRDDEPGWAVYLEVPDMNSLVSRYPEFRDVLESSRCSVQGAATDRPMARGRVLSGSRRVLIGTWPLEGETPLRFEPSRPDLDDLLRTYCLIQPKPNWLFEHQADGFAREVKSRRVKPGGEYVVVSTHTLPIDGEYLTPLALRALGVGAATLSVPSLVDENFISLTEELGVGISTEVAIWPAGLAPSSWDGIGRGEWLSTDTPRFGIRANLVIDSLLFSLNAMDPVSLGMPGLAQGETCFVETPDLDIGTHNLRVLARHRQSGHTSELGSIEIVIREPRPWVPATDESSPLLVIPDPRTPTLEQVWTGEASFHIQAPPSRTVECHLSLYESRATEPFLETVVGPLTPPLGPSEWREAFLAHLRMADDLVSAFDRTSRCRLEFRADELGTFRLECERASTPVRWFVDSLRRKGYRLRVLDDRGSDSELRLRYFSFDTPERSEALDLAAHLASPGPQARGGLYSAEWENGKQCIIMPNQIRSLEDFRVDPAVEEGARSKRRAANLTSQIEVWQGANLRGDFSAVTARNSVVDAMLRGVVDAVGDQGWAAGERSLAQFGDSRAVERLERAVAPRKYAGLYEELRNACKENDGNSRRLRRVCIAWLASAVVGQQSSRLGRHASDIQRRQSHQTLQPSWVAEFALRLVSAPRSLRLWAGEDWNLGFDQVCRKPELLRAARFAVLVAHRELTPQPLDPDVVYTGWDWE